MEKCELKVIGVANVWPKGQIVIPKELRELLWVKTWDGFVVILKGGKFIGLVRNEDMSELMAYFKSEEKGNKR